MIDSTIGILTYLRDINVASTALRLTCAMLFGGLIGIERERKRRPAGFRTYMIVCLGATLTMLLGQYETLMLHTRWAAQMNMVGISTDASRFGAQVINGVGFLGAGTIIVTGRQEVKGLTTAAGLWASACMGLAIGAGFYECMIIGFLLIFLSIKVFPIIENVSLNTARYMNIYVEFASLDGIGSFIQRIKGNNIRIFDVDLDKGMGMNLKRPNAVFSIYLPRKTPHTEVLATLSLESNISLIEEI